MINGTLLLTNIGYMIPERCKGDNSAKILLASENEKSEGFLLDYTSVYNNIMLIKKWINLGIITLQTKF